MSSCYIRYWQLPNIMQFPYMLVPGESLAFKPGLPAYYQGPLLPGAVASFAKTNTTSIVTQLIAGDFYSIRFSLFRFLEKIKTVGRVEAPGLYSRFQLRTAQRHVINNKERLHLRQDHCAGFWITDGDCSSQFLPEKDYHSLDIYVAPQLLEEYSIAFPELKELMNKKTFDWIPGKACRILPSIHQVLDDILYCPFDAATRQLYMDLKIRELVTHILHYRYQRNQSQYNFTRWEIYRINELKNVLEEYISSKPPSLHALSKMVGIKEGKLKDGFMHVFQCSIFEWLMEAKMRRAKELLITTDQPIKVICRMVGYPRVSNFITAFRRRFGHTPGSFRR